MADLSFDHEKTFRINPSTTVPNVNLIQGVGSHRLVVTVDVQSIELPANLPIQLSGDLQAKFDDSGERWLGAFQVKTLVTRGFSRPEQLYFPLSNHQIQAIEALREGRDLQFHLGLAAVLLHPVEGLFPQTYSEERWQVTAEAWMRQLGNVGAAVAIEVLVPFPLDGTELRQAVGRLREAKGHITDGSYEQAVVKARLALDFVRKILPSDDETTKARDRTQSQRWHALVDALYGLASGAVHDDDVTARFKWSRDDAITIVGAVAGLIARLPR